MVGAELADGTAAGGSSGAGVEVETARNVVARRLAGAEQAFEAGQGARQIRGIVRPRGRRAVADLAGACIFRWLMGGAGYGDNGPICNFGHGPSIATIG